MAKRGTKGTIGEANVVITGDLTDLKKAVAEGKKEVEGIGKTGKRSRRGTISDDRRSTGGIKEELGTLATLRRALGIGAFVSGVAASFFKLGQALREAFTHERAYSKALEERGALLEQTAEQESEGLKKIAKELNLELAAFREGTAVERAAYAAAARLRGRPESLVQELLNAVQEQQSQATSRLDRERSRNELAKANELNKRILDELEKFREQQRQASDRALAQQQVAASRLEAIIGLRAEVQRR